MENKIQALETMIDIVISLAEDKQDLEIIVEMLYDRASTIDEKITDLENEEM